jgi:predicted AAA+ superfamily ATPase
MAGAFFETFVIAEILKSYFNAGINNPHLYFYRDKDGNEIDLIIENDGVLHPLEIKKHSDPRKEDIRSFSHLDKLGKRGPGGVICTYDGMITLSGEDMTIPVWMI